jgi:hypothetical protein
VEKEAFITAGLIALTSAALFGWFFMTRHPARWAALVERENNFWRDKAIVSGTFAEKLKRWETGRVLRLLCLLTACVGIVGVAITLNVWVKAIELRRHKFRALYNPALNHPKTPAPAKAQPKK